MKINNLNFEATASYADVNLLITFPYKEFTRFFSTISLDNPVTIEEYEDYTIPTRLIVNPTEKNFSLEVAMDKDDTQAITIITGKENVTVTQAHAMREQIEKVATYIPDEEAEEETWLFPTWNGDGVQYKVGDRVQYESMLYKCIQAHTSQSDWTPSTAVSLWVRTNDPQDEFPQWVQPTGAHDAYAKGDKVSHNSKHWISNVDANIWEPGQYGWDEA